MIKSLARNTRFWTRFTVLSIYLTLLVSLARAGDERPFKGSFHGFAEAPTSTADSNVVEIVILLKGKATHLGEYEMLLVHQLNVRTLAVSGHSEWRAANGDQLYTTLVGQGYPTEDSAWISFDVTHTITWGTGRFEGATGTFEGVDGRVNLLTGEDLGGYLGTISF